MPNYKEISWNDFKDAIIANKDYIKKNIIKDNKYVYGLPRGGLPLAVLISHIFGLKLLTQFSKEDLKHTVLVDDIYDSGNTIQRFINTNLVHPTVTLIFGISKSTTEEMVGRSIPKTCEANIFTILPIHTTGEWILFPWEVKDNVEADIEEYSNKD